MKPDKQIGCYIWLHHGNQKGYLEFWCKHYRPVRMHYPKKEYIKGEELCNLCAMPDIGFYWSAPFQCTRVPSPTMLRFACPRNLPKALDGGASTGNIPSDYRRCIADLFGWLYGGIETKRSVAKKAVKAGKVTDDQYRADNGKVARILQGNTERKEIKSIKASSGTQEVKQQIVTEPVRPDPADTGLQGLSESIPVRNNNSPVPGIINDIEMQPMWTENDLQENRKQPVNYLQAVFEPAMTVEYDPSYVETTAHACITCKCGRKVWYGCSKKKHHTRPKYCKSCTEKEAMKLREKFVDYMDKEELQRLIDSELRRVIT